MDARVTPAHDDVPMQIARPLLDVPKSRLLATLAAAKIPFADDPSNRDPRFTRPRLRELMPALAAEGLDARRLAALARRVARADAAIERAVSEAARRLTTKSGTGIAFGPGYADLPAEISLRLLRPGGRGGGERRPGRTRQARNPARRARPTRWPKEAARRFRRTLAGAMITLSGAKLTVEPAPPRRTGAKTGKPRPAKAVHQASLE